MIVLCVDDEVLLLRALERAVKKSPDVTDTAAFTSAQEALMWASNHPVDIAFLDIELDTINGVELAQMLLAIHPDLSIVFCTSYEQYAIKVMNLHIDAGYLIKPVRDASILAEISRIKEAKADHPRLNVRCFGNFEVFVDKKPLQFKRKRTKELLAYLVDRRGAFVNSNEMCAVLWEEEADNAKSRDYLYHLIADLKQTLSEAGVGDVLIAGNRGYAINTACIDCDYYRFLNGDPKVSKRFAGEYMHQFSWAETTAAWLQSQYLS